MVSVGVLSLTGAVWASMEFLTRQRLRRKISSIVSISTRNDWSNWLVVAAKISVDRTGVEQVPCTIHQMQRANMEGVWALSEQAEALLELPKNSQEGHEIIVECALRITTLCSSQTFFDGDPWRLAIAACVYARCGLRSRTSQILARMKSPQSQRKMMMLRDRQLVSYLYLLRVLRSHRFDTEELQTTATVQLETRIMRTLDEEGTAALPTILASRTATKAAERILQSTAPVHARRIAAWALARGTE